MSTLFICPTPIGNLEDISERVLKTLAMVDVIYCEDTRRAKKLTDNFSITTPLKSYFVGNEVTKVFEIEETLSKSMNVALISDAGTPLISDPGSKLIQKLIYYLVGMHCRQFRRYCRQFQTCEPNGDYMIGLKGSTITLVSFF